MAAKAPVKFFMSHPDPQLANMFSAAGCSQVHNWQDANFCVFPGGSDVIPILYGQKPLVQTNFVLSRDLRETKLYHELPRAMPKVGVCRGAQFLCVMAGGSLYQHVNNHLGDHDAKDMKSGRVLKVTSTHHQMMNPPSHAKVLMMANMSTSKEDEFTTATLNIGVDDPIPYWDVEAIFSKDEKILAFQPHPEYGVKSCRDYFMELMNSYIFNRLY